MEGAERERVNREGQRKTDRDQREMERGRERS